MIVHKELEKLQAYLQVLEDNKTTLRRTQSYLEQTLERVTSDYNGDDPIPLSDLTTTLENALKVSRGRFYLTHYYDKFDKAGRKIEPLIVADDSIEEYEL